MRLKTKAEQGEKTPCSAFSAKYRTLPDLKVKSKIYFGVVSKNGGKSEDAQEQLLRKLLKQHYSGITVALFIQCGRKNPVPILVGTPPIPPPTPLLAGTPTRTANSPEPSYMPQVMSTAFT